MVLKLPCEGERCCIARLMRYLFLFQRPTPTFAANVAEVFLWMPDYWLLLSKINHLTGRLTSDWSSACNRRQFPHSLQLLKSDLKLWTAFLAIEVILGRDVSPEVLLKRHFIRRLTTRDILGCLRFCNINVIDNWFETLNSALCIQCLDSVTLFQNVLFRCHWTSCRLQTQYSAKRQRIAKIQKLTLKIPEISK